MRGLLVSCMVIAAASCGGAPAPAPAASAPSNTVAPAPELPCEPLGSWTSRLDRPLRERVTRHACGDEPHPTGKVLVDIRFDPAIDPAVLAPFEFREVGLEGLGTVVIDLDDLEAIERLVSHPQVYQLVFGEPPELD